MKNPLDETPVVYAAQSGHHHVLKYFFELGVKPLDESVGVNLLFRGYSNHETYIIVADEILRTSGREGLSKVYAVFNYIII